MMTIAELKTEIDTDPGGLGLVALAAAGADQAIADLLNLPRAGAGFQVFSAEVGAAEFLAALDPAEFALLNATQCAKLSVLLAAGSIAAGVPAVRTMVLGVFVPAGSYPVTRAALAGLAKRSGSRAEVRWGAGALVRHEHVHAARML